MTNRLLQQGKFLLKLVQTDNPPIQNPKSFIQNGMLPAIYEGVVAATREYQDARDVLDGSQNDSK